MNYNRTNTKAIRANGTLNIIHHVGVINKNLDTLSHQYEKLGFLLTPVSTPKIIIEPGESPKALGIGNRHAIFEKNYLELLGIVDSHRWKNVPKDKLGPYNIDIPLKRHEGLHVMHFGTNHIELVKQRFGKMEIPSSEIKYFQRNVQTEAGEQTMKARTIFFPLDKNPEGLLQVAQTDTPELVFQRQYMVHSNGAIRLIEHVLCCENPGQVAKKYEKFTGHKCIEIENNYFIIDLGDSKIIIIAPEHFADIVPDYIPPTIPFMVAFTIETSDLQLAKNILMKNNVSFKEKEGNIVVNPNDAGGCAVIFK